MKTESPVLTAALSYVKRGWEVFPSPFGTKSGYPKGEHFTDSAWGKTTSATVVRKYWRRWPRANIGVPMGVGSGVFDLEYDTPEAHSKDGARSWGRLVGKHGSSPATLMFESPTGSVHRLFKHPGGEVKIRTGPLDAENYPGIDCKGDNSMSIVPPSRTSKGVYRWINKRRIARAPQWLLDMVIKPERARSEPANYFEQFARSLRQVDMKKLRLATGMLPNTRKTDRETWVRVGFALWAATGGSEEGYQIFAAWSRRWPEYNADKIRNAKNTRTFWDTIKRVPDKITAGTIFYLAEEAVPDWFARINAREPKVIKLLREFHKLLGEPS